MKDTRVDARAAVPRRDRRARANLPGGRVQRRARRPVPAGRDQSALERERDDRDDAVAAHRAEALVVHEEHAGVRIGALGLGEQRAVHVGVAARLEHQRAPQVVLVLRAQARRSSIVRPCGAGQPSTTSRSGSPAVWASIVRKIEERICATIRWCA